MNYYKKNQPRDDGLMVENENEMKRHLETSDPNRSKFYLPHVTRWVG